MGRPSNVKPETIEIVRRVLAQRREFNAIPSNNDLKRSLRISGPTLDNIVRKLSAEHKAELDRKARELRQRVTCQDGHVPRGTNIQQETAA